METEITRDRYFLTARLCSSRDRRQISCEPPRAPWPHRSLLSSKASAGGELVNELSVIRGVENFDIDIRIKFAEQSNLAVLFGYKRLLRGRQFDVQIMIGQVKVWSEAAGDLSLIVPFNGERTRFVQTMW